MGEIIIIKDALQLTVYAKELALFFKIYEYNFPDVNEREEPQIILDRIKLGKFKLYSPETTILLVISGEKVMGGAIIEYYTESQCFLLTYILVDNDFRGKGVSRLLVEQGIKTLVESKKSFVKAVFFESNIPWKTVNDSFNPWERYEVFAKLGAKWIDINYTQPPLGTEQIKVHNLHFLIFPSLTGLDDKIDKSVLISFMTIFYMELGIKEPEKDSDFQNMITSIEASSNDKYLILKELPKK